MTKSKVLQIRIEPSLLKKLQELSNKNALSISSQVRMLIKKGVDYDL